MRALLSFIGANALLVFTLFVWVFVYRCERPRQARSEAEQAEDLRRAFDHEATERELFEP